MKFIILKDNIILGNDEIGKEAIYSYVFRNYNINSTGINVIKYNS